MYEDLSYWLMDEKAQKSRQIQPICCTFRGQRTIDSGDFGRILEELKSRTIALIDQTEVSDLWEFSV